MSPDIVGVPGSAGFGFVGRRREIGLILEALRDPPAVVLVEGEAGIGKSRLVREAAAAMPGLPVLTGLCHPLREPFPFGPVLDALRAAGRRIPQTALAAPSAGALAPLLPDLADRLPPPLRVPDDPQMARHQLVQGIRSVLEGLGPTLLIIEDLHWADEATRELLLLLGREPPDQLRLVFTYRGGKPADGVLPLGAAYHRPPGTSGTTVRLGPLSQEEIQQLADRALGPRATPVLGRILFDRSEGLPLVAEEDLLTLIEYGVRPSAETDLAAALEQADIPVALRQAVTERLEALSPAGAAVVGAAAVLAVPASEARVARVANLPPDLAGNGLVEALEAALLRESDFDRYVFRHVLAQQAVYRHLPGPHRTRLHRQALEALRQLSPPPLVQLAHHARALGEHEQWLAYAEAAADQAIALGDHGTAVAQLRQILADPQLAADPRSRAALALARIADNGTDHTANAVVLRRILADPRLPSATRGDIRLTLGIMLATHEADRAGFREIERGLDELDGFPDRAARGMVTLALNERDLTPDQAWDWLRRAEEAVRTGPFEAMRATAWATRLTLLARAADPAVWPLLDELPRQCEDPEILHQTARALYNVGDLSVELGHDQRGQALLEESHALARQTGNLILECLSRIVLLRLDALAGRWADLEQRFTRLGDEFPDVGMAVAEPALVTARLAAAHGRPSKALEFLKRAEAVGRRDGQVFPSCRAAAEIALLQLAQGEPEQALETVRPAVAVLRRARTWPRATGLVPAAVESALACGDREYAGRLAADCEHALDGLDAPAALAELHVARGLLMEDADGAAGHFALARAAWERIGRPYEAARAAERQAAAMGRRRSEECAAHLTAAAAAFHALGATADESRCLNTQRDLGLADTSPPGRRGYGSQLSPRERQVADLLAHGATNQDIAATLFLSPRTVEQHVAHLLKKLGVARRDVGEALAAPDKAAPDEAAPGPRPRDAAAPR